MFSNVALLVSLLGTSALAFPGVLEKNDVCNADNCLRAVRATNAKPYPSSATADCSSFLRKTVTPCPATTTATAVITLTNPAVTRTVASVGTSLLQNTLTQTLITTVTTILDTATVTQATEIDVTTTIIATTTVTEVAGTAKRRDISTKPLPTIPTVEGKVQVRVVTSTCAATTNGPSSVPTYASACSGTVRYSSACSCAVGPGATTTLPQSTVTVTSTSTQMVTPTTTATALSTSIVPVTSTQTQTVPTTFETTAVTTTLQAPFTVTTSLLSTSTVIVSPPVCSSYKLTVTSGSRTGQFINGQIPQSSPNTATYGFVSFVTDPTATSSFTLRSNGKVYGGNNELGWVTQNSDEYYILQMTDYSQSVYNIPYVFCSLATPAGGAFTCKTSAGTPIYLASCSGTGNNLQQIPNPSSNAASGCTVQSLSAVLSC